MMKHSGWPRIFSSLTTIFIILSLLLEVRFVRQETCSFDVDSLGWTDPRGDIILQKGSDLEIRCFLNPDTGNFNSSQIFFTRNNAPNVRIPSNNVFIENATVAILRLKHLPLMKDQWFFCKVALPNNSVEFRSSLEDPSPMNETMICYNSVSVGTKPKEVENFSCISYNWKVLKCNWSVPDNEIRTDYTIFYRIPNRGGRNMVFRCPTNDDVNNHNCSWSLDSKPPYRNNFRYLNFIITGNNTFGNITQEFQFHNFAHILPAAPRNLTFVEKTTSSICLQWNIDDLYSFEPGWKYNIMYIWNSSNMWNKTIYEPYHTEEVLQFNVTDLKYPYTAYDFRVYMMSAAAYNNSLWSEPASLVVKTKACRPYRSPFTDIGSFELVPAAAETNRRSVYVYWQLMPVVEYNGEDFQYVIDVFEEDREVEKRNVSLRFPYEKFEISFRRHTFLVWSANKEGRAEGRGSVVQVPARADTLKLPKILSKMDFGHGIYELSWKIPDISRSGIVINNYTTFWCETKKDWPYRCDGYIDWIHLPASVNKHNFTVNSTSVYQFAVSVNTEFYSSGMVWAECTVLHDRINKIKDMWVDKIGSYYISIRWKLECADRIDGIKGYYVYYCVADSQDQGKCNGSMKNITVYGDLDTNQANITKLEPYRYYRISVSMFSNRIGPPSDTLVSRTLDGPPDMTGVTLMVTSITNTSITLQWKPPSIMNGVLQSYQIFYNQHQQKLAANETETTLINLTSYETYEIKLQACTLICSEPTHSIFIRTKIGVPALVEQRRHQNFNSTHVIISWSRPAIPAGPQPRYRVRMRLEGADNETKDKLTTNNSIVVDLSNCRSGSYSVDVRAENVNESSNEVFVGQWLQAFSQVCSSSTGMSLSWKIIIFFTLMLLLGSIFVILGKKGLYKCKQMKSVEVAIPAKFIEPRLFSVDHKEAEFYEDFSVPPTKSVEEFYSLVDQTAKTTEMSLFSSQT